LTPQRGPSIGVLGGGPPAAIDPVGTLWPAAAAWTVEWWIGADDRWRVPEHEVAVRQQRVQQSAVVETAMRVPGGDAVLQVYAVAGTGAPVVLDVENRSPAPFVVAFVVRGASRIVADERVASIDDAFGLTWARAPSRWARTVGAPVLVPVTTGRAESGAFPATRDRAGRLEVAFLHPVAHRTTLRTVLTHGKGVPVPDVRALPDAATVAAGWRRQLDRGMQVQLPDRALEARVRESRTEVLLRGQARRPDPAVVAALEDWGFVDEAEAAWRRLGARDRRSAATRPAVGSWSELDAIADPARLLLAVRRLLVDDPRRPGTVTLLAEHPAPWRGQPVEVRDAPVTGGTLSYAVRWHGARPALLWTAPPGADLRIPGLDPTWRSDAPSGDALLAPVGGAA
jgi:hypothetical protein